MTNRLGNGKYQLFQQPRGPYFPPQAWNLIESVEEP